MNFKNKILLLIWTVMVAVPVSFESHATVYGPSTSSTGSIRISWTNTADSRCSSYYFKVSRYVNGQFKSTHYVNDRSRRYYDFTETSSATYRYYVSRRGCTSSTGYASYLAIGDVTVQVQLVPVGKSIFKYDAAGRLIKVEQGNGSKVEYLLDDAGNRTKVIQQGGN